MAKKQPLPPFVLQVLTTEYLIEGTAPGDMDVDFQGSDSPGSPIYLTNVQIKSTRLTQESTHTCASYVITRRNAVALIPRTDFSQLSEYPVWKQMGRHCFTGAFHLGPYWMTGRLCTMAPDRIVSGMPVYDVRFGSLIPGTLWGALAAPFALVNGFWIHGWEPK